MKRKWARKRAKQRRVRAKRRYKKRRYKKRRYTAKRRYKKRRTSKNRRLMSDAAWRRYVKRKNARKRARKRGYVAKRRKKVRRKKVRRYSKKWWANYRARKARKKAVSKRKRQMRVRAARKAKVRRSRPVSSSARAKRIAAAKNVAAAKRRPAAAQMPKQVSGDVSVEVVGASVGETVTRGRNTTLGGVSTTMLRRTVIDQMIRDNGWVENDYHKEIAGKKVYVVEAKAPDKNNRVQSRRYYFTESNGRIYRVATRSSQNGGETADKRSEDMIRALDRAAKPQQARKQ